MWTVKDMDLGLNVNKEGTEEAETKSFNAIPWSSEIRKKGNWENITQWKALYCTDVGRQD